MSHENEEEGSITPSFLSFARERCLVKRPTSALFNLRNKGEKKSFVNFVVEEIKRGVMAGNRSKENEEEIQKEADASTGSSRRLTDLEKRVVYQSRSERHSICKSERKLLRFFMGFSKSSSRPRTRSLSEACRYVQQTLKEPVLGRDKSKPRKRGEEEEEEQREEIFDFETDLDLNEVSAFPSITKTDSNSIKNFLNNAGLKLTAIEQCSLIRCFTSFSKCYATDLHITDGKKGACGMAGGKVSSRSQETSATSFRLHSRGSGFT